MNECFHILFYFLFRIILLIVSFEMVGQVWVFQYLCMLGLMSIVFFWMACIVPWPLSSVFSMSVGYRKAVSMIFAGSNADSADCEGLYSSHVWLSGCRHVFPVVLTPLQEAFRFAAVFAQDMAGSIKFPCLSYVWHLSWDRSWSTIW